jgi:hypothetical protein
MMQGGKKRKGVMGLPPDLIRRRREKTPAVPAPSAGGKSGTGYDGPGDGYDGAKSGYDGAKSGYDGRRGSQDQSRERYDGPKKDYDGPDPAHGRVKPPGPDRR